MHHGIFHLESAFKVPRPTFMALNLERYEEIDSPILPVLCNTIMSNDGMHPT